MKDPVQDAFGHGRALGVEGGDDLLPAGPVERPPGGEPGVAGADVVDQALEGWYLLLRVAILG